MACAVVVRSRERRELIQGQQNDLVQRILPFVLLHQASDEMGRVLKCASAVAQAADADCLFDDLVAVKSVLDWLALSLARAFRLLTIALCPLAAFFHQLGVLSQVIGAVKVLVAATANSSIMPGPITATNGFLPFGSPLFLRRFDHAVCDYVL